MKSVSCIWWVVTRLLIVFDVMQPSPLVELNAREVHKFMTWTDSRATRPEVSHCDGDDPTSHLAP